MGCIGRNLAGVGAFFRDDPLRSLMSHPSVRKIIHLRIGHRLLELMRNEALKVGGVTFVATVPGHERIICPRVDAVLGARGGLLPFVGGEPVHENEEDRVQAVLRKKTLILPAVNRIDDRAFRLARCPAQLHEDLIGDREPEVVVRKNRRSPNTVLSENRVEPRFCGSEVDGFPCRQSNQRPRPSTTARRWPDCCPKFRRK